MKKIALLSICCILLLVIAYAQIIKEKKIMIDAYDEIVIKTGKSSITMKKDGSISIVGKEIEIVGTENVTAKASGNVVLKGNQIKDK